MDPWPLPKNVLTAKMGLFPVVLAGKQGIKRGKKHFILHFFTFWRFLAFTSCCLAKPYGEFAPPK